MRIRARAHDRNLAKMNQHLTAGSVCGSLRECPKLGDGLLYSVSYVSSEQFSTISSGLVNCLVS